MCNAKEEIFGSDENQMYYQKFRRQRNPFITFDHVACILRSPCSLVSAAIQSHLVTKQNVEIVWSSTFI